MTTNLDVQGHRGCRGLFPENTIPAFIHAIETGVNTLEFDVVISKDNEVIVSHEPFMSHSICLNQEGVEFLEEDEPIHNIYNLEYDSIKLFDCGTKYFERFPDQVKIKCHKPSLQDVVSQTEKLSPKILYNIEIKRRVEWDKVYHPEFKLFADLVINKIVELGILNKTTVQCFDIETLKYLHEYYPEVRLVYLIQNLNEPEINIEKLGFIPYVYSPYYKLVNASLIEYSLSRKMKVIPWTVNEKDDMIDMIKLGVDGIISDYPDRLIEVLNSSPDH